MVNTSLLGFYVVGVPQNKFVPRVFSVSPFQKAGVSIRNQATPFIVNFDNSMQGHRFNEAGLVKLIRDVRARKR